MSNDVTPDQILAKITRLFPGEKGRILERLLKEAFQLRLDLASPGGAGIVGFDHEDFDADNVHEAIIEAANAVTPGGLSGQFQYRGSGSGIDKFVGAPGLTYDPTSDETTATFLIVNQIVVGADGAGLKSVTFHNGQTLNLRANPTASRNIDLPDASGTVALLSDLSSPGGADRQVQINNAGAFGGGQLFSLSNGALSYHFPDDSPAGGIARGNQAVDLQSSRSAAGQVATGNRSFSAGGSDNITSGDNSATLGGVNNLASGTDAVSIGGNLNAAEGNQSSVIGGIENSAVGDCSSIQGGNGNVVDATYGSCRTGVFGWSYLYGQEARGAGSVGGNFAGQSSSLFLTGRTADATPTALLLFDVAGQHASLQNHFRWYADVRIIAGTTTAVAKSASFHRKVMIQRGADAASTSLIGSVQTIGADIGTNSGSPPAGWAVSIDADTTNGALRVTVTGEAATNINWLAEVSILELGEIFE